MRLRKRHTYLKFGPDGRWLGGTGSVPLVFGRPWPDGTYRLVRGALHFDDGRLTELTTDGDQGWQRPVGSAAGDCAVCVFSELRPHTPAFLAAEAVVLHFAGGRVAGHEPLGTVEVDRRDIGELPGA
jgi:hypothetical protein